MTAAAGGLGTLFVQEALSSGARVIALAGGEAKLRRLRELLADAPVGGASGGDSGAPAGAADGRLTLVDYAAAGWVDAARTALAGVGATLVLDGVGGDVGTAATALLSGYADDGASRATPRLVAYGWASGTPNRYTSWAGADRIESAFEVRYAVGTDAPPLLDQRPYQERALARAGSGRWRVLTHRVPFADAARAHRELEERRTTGKVVLV